MAVIDLIQMIDQKCRVCINDPSGLGVSFITDPDEREYPAHLGYGALYAPIAKFTFQSKDNETYDIDTIEILLAKNIDFC